VSGWTGPRSAGIKKSCSLRSAGSPAAPALRPGTPTPLSPRIQGQVRMENNEGSRPIQLWPETSARWVWAHRTFYPQGERTRSGAYRHWKGTGGLRASAVKRVKNIVLCRSMTTGTRKVQEWKKYVKYHYNLSTSSDHVLSNISKLVFNRQENIYSEQRLL